jgi:hypothetical protein
VGSSHWYQRVFAIALFDDSGGVAQQGCDISTRVVLQKSDDTDAHNVQLGGSIVEQYIGLDFVAEGRLWVAEAGIQHIASRIIVKLS